MAMAARALLPTSVPASAPSLAPTRLPELSSLRPVPIYVSKGVSSLSRRGRRFAVAVLDNNLPKSDESSALEQGVSKVDSHDDLASHYRTSLEVEQGQEEEATGIISKQWPESFYEHNVDDLALHYRLSQPDNKDVLELDSLYPSGEWPQNLFAATFEDIKSHYVSSNVSIDIPLSRVMETDAKSIHPSALVRSAKELLRDVSGLPVVIGGNVCVGIITRNDMPNMVYAVGTKVGEVMSSPPIVLKSDDTVRDAAILMLKHNIHHVPIVDDDQKLVGLVTRSHVFTALEARH